MERGGVVLGQWRGRMGVYQAQGGRTRPLPYPNPPFWALLALHYTKPLRLAPVISQVQLGITLKGRLGHYLG